MIKTYGRTSPGVPVVTLGLSRLDLDHLAMGQPIAMNLNELGLESTHIVLIGGESEQSIAEALQAAGLLAPGSVEDMNFDAKGNPTNTSE